ncbi:hypothetical protein, partial [Mangrovactinospora gilvigrisea]|uniref:hypothetical protein n=1 Tax=Mangrovactinospora gilvigrisea TaxID=1428644 RepID=UPI001C31490D
RRAPNFMALDFSPQFKVMKHVSTIPPCLPHATRSRSLGANEREHAAGIVEAADPGLAYSPYLPRESVMAVLDEVPTFSMIAEETRR